MRWSSVLPSLFLCVTAPTFTRTERVPHTNGTAKIQLLLPDSGWVTAGDGAGVRITGVPRGERVTLRARRTILVSRIIDSKNVTDTVFVASSATFDGNASGNIDVDYSTPIDGSWTTADELGLFWSMRRVNALGHDELKRERAAIDLVLESRGVQVARGSLRLRPSARAIVRRVVHVLKARSRWAPRERRPMRGARLPDSCSE